jgi:low affinity Fe/Cu permease
MASWRKRFDKFAAWAAVAAGHPVAFILAVLFLVGWVLAGFVMKFSDSWNIFGATFTSIVAFLMVFLIQSSQNRQTDAIHIKLDEVIRALAEAQNVIVSVDDLSADQLRRLRAAYRELASNARQQLREGQTPTGSPPLNPPAAVEDEDQDAGDQGPDEDKNMPPTSAR